MDAWVCVQCGGPLPGGGATEITCPWCGSTLRRGAGALTVAHAGTGTADPEARRRLIEALVAQVRATGGVSIDGLADVVQAHLGETDSAVVIARVATGLAEEFERAHRVSIRTDAIAMSRILEAYLGAFDAIRETGSAHLSLPFLTANASGPVHLERTLTPAAIAGWAAATHPVPGASTRPGCWPGRR